MKSFFLTTATVGLAMFQAATSAQILLRLDAEILKDQNGNAIPIGDGLMILVASTTDAVFNDPSADFFVKGDDVEVGRWAIHIDNASDQNGVLFVDNQSFSPSGHWNEGDPLALFWYPSLTTASTSPSVGDAYGIYRDAVGLDGGDPWVTPADSQQRNLYFLTSDSMFNGSAPHNGQANLTVVPEPTAYAVAFGIAMLGFSGIRACRAARRGP